RSDQSCPFGRMASAMTKPVPTPFCRRDTDFMSPDQTEWWLKEGSKKFPGICITSTPNVSSYVIVWTAAEETTVSSYRVPKTETTRHQGTVNTNSTSRSTTSTDTVYSSGSGTYHCTSTKTTYEEKKYEHTTLFIKAFVHKVIEVDGKKNIDRLPLFTAQHKGQWRWSKPDKDAFAKAMEFIQKQLK